MKYLKWKQQVMEWEVIASTDLTESDEGHVPESYREVVVGCRVAHTTGEGEQVAWVDILATEEQEAEINAHAS
jgi:desulfoferrodoxin (superoxide reductase-like protein)